MNWRRLAVWAAVAALIGLPTWLGAIFIVPHAVFIDHASRSAEVTVGNDGDVAEEVTVDVLFGFPDTDSAGNPFVRYIDDPGSEYPSAADWIRTFPRRMRLNPGDRQTVRLLATPPPDLPDGEYWARLSVTSRRAALPVETADTTLRATLEMVFQLVVSVTYRKGFLTTGIALNRYDASIEGDSLVVWTGLERQGTGSFLGTAEFAVLAADGDPVAEWSIPLAVYYAVERRFAFALPPLEPGDYRVALRLTSERTDLEEADVLPAEPVSDTVAVGVP